MADRRIYAGYYKRYDGRTVYVVTMAKDADSGEDVVIWTPDLYAEHRQYLTMTKKSFCEYVVVDGQRLAKFKRQPQMRIPDGMAEEYENEGFRGPMRKKAVCVADEYDDWNGFAPAGYYEYAKLLCEQYSFCVKKYMLCKAEKRYIGICKENFLALEKDLIFLQHCMKTVLKEHREYFTERFVEGLSIRKYAEAHNLNRGSVDYMQKKFYSALARVLKERDAAEGICRLKK